MRDIFDMLKTDPKLAIIAILMGLCSFLGLRLLDEKDSKYVASIEADRRAEAKYEPKIKQYESVIEELRREVKDVQKELFNVLIQKNK